jgi:hypothetical protein
VSGELAGGGDPRRRLGWERQLEPIQDELLVLGRLGVAGQDQSAPVGGREMHVEHLDRGELVEHGTAR